MSHRKNRLSNKKADKLWDLIFEYVAICEENVRQAVFEEKKIWEVPAWESRLEAYEKFSDYWYSKIEKEG